MLEENSTEEELSSTQTTKQWNKTLEQEESAKIF